MRAALQEFIFRILRKRSSSTDAQRDFDWWGSNPEQRALVRESCPPPVQIRKATKRDLGQISAIQGTSSEASQWLPGDYLAFDCEVALLDGKVAGFVVSRQVADNEREILNIAVHADLRRLGVATQLLRNQITRWPGAHFLEVRESNISARRLYERLGFEATGSRPGYYENPPEAGIVMRVFS